MPASCSAEMAAWTRFVRTLSSVTSVPSTSASTRETFPFAVIVMSFYRSGQRPPGASVARQQRIRRGRAVVASGVVREFLWRLVRPDVPVGLDRLPARFDVVGALDGDRVAVPAGVATLIGARARRRPEGA